MQEERTASAPLPILQYISPTDVPGWENKEQQRKMLHFFILDSFLSSVLLKLLQ